MLDSTHRERKDQYLKSLESEVLRLRTSEVNLLVQVEQLHNYVESLQMILAHHGIDVPVNSNSSGVTVDGAVGFDSLFQGPTQINHFDNGFQSSQSSVRNGDQGTQLSKASSRQNGHCPTTTEVIPNHSSHTQQIIPSRRGYDLLNNTFEISASQSPQTLGCIQSEPTGRLCDRDLAEVGMEFVLA